MSRDRAHNTTRALVIPAGTPAGGRGAQTARQFLVIKYLLKSGEWVRTNELIEAMYGGAYRTAYRDTEQLMALGVPIERRVVEDEIGQAYEFRLRRVAFRRWIES